MALFEDRVPVGEAMAGTVWIENLTNSKITLDAFCEEGSPATLQTAGAGSVAEGMWITRGDFCQPASRTLEGGQETSGSVFWVASWSGSLPGRTDVLARVIYETNGREQALTTRLPVTLEKS